MTNGNGQSNGAPKRGRGRPRKESGGGIEENLANARRHLGLAGDDQPSPGADPGADYGGRSEEELACEFIEEAHTARQPMAEAQMAHAAVWKRAKQANVHTGAAQLVARLERMSPEKAADFLRALDLYREARGLDDRVGLTDLVDRMFAQDQAPAPV